MDKNSLFLQKDSILDKPELAGLRTLLAINLFLLVTDFVMPQYFGIHIGYDITCTRFANILLTVYAILNSKVFNLFTNVCLRCSMTIPLALYLFVAIYTMVFRTDINAFMLVFLEVLTLYMLVLAIRYVIGIRRTIKVIIYSAYFLSAYGFLEFAAGHSLYLQFLRTVPTAVSNCYRSGYYRIMGPCGHPLGYGLLLILFIAVACIDYDKGEMFLFKRPVLLGMLVINIFLTGSRSSQGIAIVEILCILLFSNKVNRKKSWFYTLALIVLVGLFLLIFYDSKIGRYMLLQITTLIDHAFDTELSVKFGADINTLKNSEDYRGFLPQIFTLDWLNPLVGRGSNSNFGAEFYDPERGAKVFIHSVDNYYVNQYIKYAYPGMITYSIFILVTGITMICKMVKYKSEVIRALFIGFVCYFYNLWWVDALQTLKFVYVIIALFYALVFVYEDSSRIYYSEEKEVK